MAVLSVGFHVVGTEASATNTLDKIQVVSPAGMEFADGEGLNFGAMHRGRIQVLYRSTDFVDVPHSHRHIDQLAFRLNADSEFNGPVTGPARVYLSTVPASQLSNEYARNTGTDETRAFADIVTWHSRDEQLGYPRAFDLAIPLTTPFLYDSRKGNLLVDIVVDRNWSGDEGLFIDRHRSRDKSPELTLVYGDQTSRDHARSFDRTVLPAEFRFVDPLPGDANFDGQFDSVDLVKVFQAGEYADDVALNSRWDTGDWNGDYEFTSDDLVAAFLTGEYVSGRGASSVAEPSTALSFVASAIMLILSRRIHQ